MAFVTEDAAPDAIEPAELVTRERPSDAFDVALEPASWTFVAASEVVEACLMLLRRRKNRDWRRTAREEETADILVAYRRID